MEFLFVEFDLVRSVFVDGKRLGTTNRTLQCRAGLRTFDLGTPVDYSPASQDVNVTGTTKDRPCHVKFVAVQRAFITAARMKAAKGRVRTPSPKPSGAGVTDAGPAADSQRATKIARRGGPKSPASPSR